MLIVTTAATAHLADVLKDAPDEMAVRIIVHERSLTPRLDMPRESDTSFQHEGRTVLVMDPELAKFLADRILDFRETDRGTHLVLGPHQADASVS